MTIKRFFVVDDNELTRVALKRKFEDVGGAVYTSGNLEKSLTALKGTIAEGQPPSLIIIDIRLPECYGFHALKKLNEAMGEARIPIIVVSNGFNQLAKRQMAIYGVVGFVEKPVLINELFEFSVKIVETLMPNAAKDTNQELDLQKAS